MEILELVKNLSGDVKSLADKIDSEQKSLREQIEHIGRQSGGFEEMKHQLSEVRQMVDDIYARKSASGVRDVTLKAALEADENWNRLVARKSGTYQIVLPDELLTKAITTADTERLTAHLGAYGHGTTSGGLRRALTTIPTDAGAVTFARMGTPTAAARAEGADTADTDPATTPVTLPVRNIAVMVHSSRESLEDVPGLEATIAGVISDSLENEIEAQLIAGSGTGANLTGFASVVPTYTAPANETKLDSIAKAAGQLAQARAAVPQFVCLRPADFWEIVRTKETNGLYVFGSPAQSVTALFGMQLIIAPSMPTGKFLVGNASPAYAAIRQKRGLMVEISTEHADNFKKGLVSIRAEARMALCVFRPNAFVYGTFAA